VRAQIQSVDPNLPVFNVRSMDEVIGVSLASRRFSAELVGGFAAVALLLAAIGIYGLLAYMVGQRSHEIGVRMALGAGRGDILKMVLRQGVVLVGAGLLAGLVLTFLAARGIGSLLVGVSPSDPVTLVSVAVLLAAVGLVASYIPARRAMNIEPLRALKYE